jgi:hypothetical protein
LLTARPAPASKDVILFDLRAAGAVPLDSQPAGFRHSVLSSIGRKELVSQALAALPGLIVGVLGRSGLDTLETAIVLSDTGSETDDLTEPHTKSFETLQTEEADRLYALELAENERAITPRPKTRGGRRAKKSRSSSAKKSGALGSSVSSTRRPSSPADEQNLAAQVKELTQALSQSQEELEETKEQLGLVTKDLAAQKKKKPKYPRGICERTQCAKNRKRLDNLDDGEVNKTPKGKQPGKRGRTSAQSEQCAGCPTAKRQKKDAERRADDLQDQLEDKVDELESLQAQFILQQADSKALSMALAARAAPPALARSPAFCLDDVSKFLVDVNASQVQGRPAQTDTVKLVEAIMRGPGPAIASGDRQPQPDSTPLAPAPKSYTFDEIKQFMELRGGN